MKDNVLVARLSGGIDNPTGNRGRVPFACPHGRRGHDWGGMHLRERRYREAGLVGGPTE